MRRVAVQIDSHSTQLTSTRRLRCKLPYDKHFGDPLSRADFFFFQAEDGIRDGRVTGVQTCALPISQPALARRFEVRRGHYAGGGQCGRWPDLAGGAPRTAARALAVGAVVVCLGGATRPVSGDVTSHGRGGPRRTPDATVQ